MSSRQSEDALQHLNIPIPSLTCSHPILQTRQCYSDKLLDSINTQSVADKVTLGQQAERTIRQRISHYIQQEADDADNNHIVLTTSGMTAIYSALRLIQQHYLSTLQQVGDTTTTTTPSMATAKGLDSTDVVVFGFPYLDTLKVSSLVHYSMQSNFHTCVYM